MNGAFLNHTYVILALGVLYHILPKRKMLVDNLYFFVGIGMMIYILVLHVLNVDLEGFVNKNDKFDINGMYNKYNNSGTPSSNVAPSSGAPSSNVAPSSGAPSSNNVPSTALISDADILKHVQTIIKSVDNKVALSQIKKALSQIENADIRESLMKIYDLTVQNPILIGRLVLTSPQNIIELASLANQLPELRDTLNKSKTTNKNADSVKLLENKLDKLEGIIKQLDNKDSIPEFLKKMMAQQKYIDQDGLMRDAIKSDMKYNQLNPEQMQHDITRADDEWDTTGFTFVDPNKLRPPEPIHRDYYQEKECPVCPSLTSGYPVNLMDFDVASRVIGSDNISLDYIKKLNERK